MATLLDDASLLEHDDPRRVTDGADSVRGDQCRSSRQRLAQRAQNLCFRVRVHRRKCVVEQHNAWLSGKRARQ